MTLKYLKNPWGTYHTRETHLDATARCCHRCQIEEMWTLLKHCQLSGSRHSPWQLAVSEHTIYAIQDLKHPTNTTKQRWFWACVASFDYYTKLFTYCSRTERIVAKTSADSRRETRRKRITRPTNTVTEAGHPSSVIHSKIKVPTPWTLTAVIAELAAFACGNSQKEKTNRLDLGLDPSTTADVPVTSRTKNFFLLCFRQYSYWGRIRKEVDSKSEQITKTCTGFWTLLLHQEN